MKVQKAYVSRCGVWRDYVNQPSVGARTFNRRRGGSAGDRRGWVLYKPLHLHLAVVQAPAHPFVSYIRTDSCCVKKNAASVPHRRYGTLGIR